MVLVLLDHLELFSMATTEQIDFKNLSTIPADVKKIIQKEQEKKKQKKGVGKYSIALTICDIIKEWNNKCNES